MAAKQSPMVKMVSLRSLHFPPSALTNSSRPSQAGRPVASLPSLHCLVCVASRLLPFPDSSPLPPTILPIGRFHQFSQVPLPGSAAEIFFQDHPNLTGHFMALDPSAPEGVLAFLLFCVWTVKLCLRRCLVQICTHRFFPDE